MRKVFFVNNFGFWVKPMCNINILFRLMIANMWISLKTEGD